MRKVDFCDLFRSVKLNISEKLRKSNFRPQIYWKHLNTSVFPHSGPENLKTYRPKKSRSQIFF